MSLFFSFFSFHFTFILMLDNTHSADEKIVLYSGSMHDGRHLQLRRSLYRAAKIEFS